jgi:hypothetical protein
MNKIKSERHKKIPNNVRDFSDLAGVRTQDPLLKREMLYQLSYQIFRLGIANITVFLWYQKLSSIFIEKKQKKNGDKKLMHKKIPNNVRDFSDLAGVRTQDPLLKREMLYQLSYQIFRLRIANITVFLWYQKLSSIFIEKKQKIKAFRTQFRGVRNIDFFLFRLTNIFA